MMVKQYVVGMDCGTTNIKAIIMGDDGIVAAQASRPSRFLTPGPDMHEQDANEWWENTKSIFRQLTSMVGDEVTSRIRGICISSHTVTLLPLDKDGRPLRNAITYQDNRSGDELHYIVNRVGHDRYINTVAAQPAVAFLPSKLLWFKIHESDLFMKTACLLQASSYINFKLTGVLSSDEDQASRTQCIDQETGAWSDVIGNAMGIDLHQLLPEPVPINEIIGTVTKESAEETGLREGIPVLAGCSDAMASMYATGMSHLGEAGESSGTTSLVFVGSDKKSAPDIPIVTRPCSIDGMPWIFDAPIQTSGGALKWYIDIFAGRERKEAEEAGEDIFDYLNRQALEAEPGSGGVFFFPYLLGERAPLWNDYAKAMFIGLSMNTSRAQITRSIFEGTAYALRHVIETVKEYGGKAELLRICGGGAKSQTWSKIKASMLHIPVYLIDEEGGDVPVGDSLIAGLRTGVFPDLTEAVKKIVKIKKIIEPDDEWCKAYDQLFPYYLKMYRDLDKDLKRLNETIKTLK